LSEKRLFKIFGMDKEVHQYLDEKNTTNPQYLLSESIFSSNVQSFCICYQDTKIPVGAFSCFPYIERKKWTNTKLLRVSSPVILEEGRISNEILYVLMNEIFLLARRARVVSVEFEIYSDILSDIFFPSTNTIINVYNSTEWVKYLQYYKLKIHSRKSCFEIKLSEFNFNKSITNGVTIRKIRMEDENDQKLYYDIWTESSLFPYAFRETELWFPNVFGWPRLWYDELPYILRSKDYILFAEVDGKAAGFIHWWPNIYPLVKSNGVHSIYATLPETEKLFAQIKEGKIFRIAVSPKAPLPKKEVEGILLQAAMKTMKEQYQMEKCQVGNIPEHDVNLTAALQEMGGRPVHQILYMRH